MWIPFLIIGAVAAAIGVISTAGEEARSTATHTRMEFDRGTRGFRNAAIWIVVAGTIAAVVVVLLWRWTAPEPSPIETPMPAITVRQDVPASAPATPSPTPALPSPQDGIQIRRSWSVQAETNVANGGEP